MSFSCRSQIAIDSWWLDESHQPHITLIQRYVRTEDLEKVYAAAIKVLGRTKVSSFKLEAVRYESLPLGDLGLTAITASRPPSSFSCRQTSSKL